MINSNKTAQIESLGSSFDHQHQDNPNCTRHIYIGTDHRGSDLATELWQRLQDQYAGDCISYIASTGPQDDYVDVSYKISQTVANDPIGWGILICGSGAGVDMIANKTDGVRCALVFDKARAIQAREHENVNMVSLPADVLDQHSAWEIVKAYLDTPFSNAPRHKRRLKKMAYYEKFGHIPMITPSVLASNYGEYQDKLNKIRGYKENPFEWIHVDYMDGEFVPSISLTPEEASHEVYHKTEVHLMVKHPQEWLERVIKTQPSRIIFHLESADPIDQVISYIRDNFVVEIGLAINPETAIDDLIPYLKLVDMILVMSVHPGFGGQHFLPEYEKLAKLRQLSAKMVIGIDGGVSPDNAKQLLDSGVNNLVIGSYLLEDNINESIETLWTQIES